MILTFIFLFYLNIRKKTGRFDALLKAVVLFALFLFSVTELLSVFYIFNRPVILGVWLISDAALLILLFRHKDCLLWIKDDVLSMVASVKQNKIISIGFILIFVFVIFTALLTVPYNWDSMTYHLTRMAVWAENGSVGHYPTYDIREISSPPFTEFVMLNLYVMCGGSDMLLNMVQALSFVLNTLLVFKISRRLGTDKCMSFFAAAVFISTPIVFAESLSTQVDQFATVWLLIFVYYAVGFIEMNDELSVKGAQLINLIIMALCLGFGYLSKPTVIPAAVVTAFWLILERVRKKDSIITIIKSIIVEFVIAGFVIFPEIIRNFISFNALSAPATGQRQLVGTANPLYLFVNMIKNICFNLANQYIYAFGFRLQNAVYALAGALGVNINDPAIAEDGTPFEVHYMQIYDHDGATNVITVSIIMFCVLILLIRFFKNRGKKMSVEQKYSLNVFLIFFLMCIIVRWEPFMNRYMLPVYALCAPAIASQIEYLEKYKFRIPVCSVVIFLCGLELWGLANYHLTICYHQLKQERALGYYYKDEEAYGEEYSVLQSYINDNSVNCAGMITAGNAFKYPEWNLMKKNGINPQNVIIDEKNTIKDEGSFDVLITIKYNVGDEIVYNGRKYRLACGKKSRLGIYEPAEK